LLRFDTIQQCDGRTDRQTPRPWLRRAKHSAIARKNPAFEKKLVLYSDRSLGLDLQEKRSLSFCLLKVLFTLPNQCIIIVILWN